MARRRRRRSSPRTGIEAPVDFTVKSDPQRWAEAFGGVVLPTGSVRVEQLAGPVAELPGFADGAWWVQDAAASLPARLLGDLCRDDASPTFARRPAARPRSLCLPAPR